MMGKILGSLLFLGTSALLLAQTHVQTGSQAQYTQKTEDLAVVLAPLHRTIFTIEINGIVKHVHKRMGEAFKKGDPLIDLEDRPFYARLLRAKSLVAKGEAEVSSKSQLYSQNLTSTLEMRNADATLASAYSELAEAEILYEACHIVGPYEGKVVAVYMIEEEFGLQGRNMMEVIYDEILLGKVLIPAYYLPRLKIGQEVRIHVLETDSVVSGEIARIDAEIDPASAMVKMDIKIDNHDGHLRAGMIGKLQE